MSDYSEKELEVFKYLFTLQESGITNMLGAAPYIKRNFQELSLDNCETLLMKWMHDYEKLTKI
jgi:hypothetical protein